jgi:hypothetical protein
MMDDAVVRVGVTKSTYAPEVHGCSPPGMQGQEAANSMNRDMLSHEMAQFKVACNYAVYEEL